MFRLLIALLLLSGMVYADNPPERIYDHGTLQGVAFNLDCQGSGIVCTQSGIKGTLTVNSSQYWNLMAGNVGIDTLLPVATGQTTQYNSTSQLTVTGGTTTEAAINAVSTSSGCDLYNYLLLHFDGTDGQTTTTDSNCGAASAHTMTRNTVALSTTQKQFGTASSLMNGTGSATYGWSTSAPSDLSLGSSNFTIKGWVYFTAVTLQQDLIDKENHVAAPHFEYSLTLLSGNTLQFEYSTTGTNTSDATFSWTPSLNTWYYVELDRSGSNLYAFVGQANGTASQIGSTYNIGASAIHNDTTALWTGISFSNAGWGATYYMDDVGIDIGVARHTAGFSVPTAAFATSTVMPTLTLAGNGLTLSQVQTNSNTGTMSLINNGTSAINVLSGGNVGVGSATPGQVLDVNGGVRAVGTNPVVLGSDNSVSIASSAASSGAMTLKTNSLERMRIDNSGNVGIGTVTPAGALTVMNGNVGIGTWTPAVALDVIGNGTGTFRLERAGIGNFDIAISGISSDALDLLHTANTTNAGYYWRTKNGSGSTIIAMGINSSGNVGIGTTLPSGLLEVGNQKFDVLNGGNVGIGSITPGQVLDVQGTIRVIGNSGRFVSSQVTAPTVANNDCGTTAQGTIVANSSDLSGTVTVGTLTVTSCAVTFNGTFKSAANCLCQDDSNVLAVKCTASTTKLTITSLTSMDSDKVTWWCPGNS